MEKAPIIVEQIVNAPIQKVWKAITDKDEMKKWYFDLEEFEPRIGFEFEFYAGDNEHQYLHQCKIIAVAENERLVHSWCYAGNNGYSVVSFELSDFEGKTKVKLTHEGVESFAGTDPNMEKESFIAGWNDIIKNLLKDFVEETDM